MTDRTPVTTLAELDTLDPEEMFQGYLDGIRGEPEPGDNRSKAYWHGWCVGSVDMERMSVTDGMKSLAREVFVREHRA